MKNGKYCRSKKAMKPLAVLLAMILLVGCAVGGTLAWLTAQTTEVKNTFTSAKLFDDPENEFTLWEHKVADVDGDGKYEWAKVENETVVKVDDRKDADKVEENDYRILPGVNIPKDPTVDIVNLKENGYLYIKVTGNMPASMYTIDPTNWTKLDDIKYPGVWVYNNGAVVTPTNALTVSILTNNQIVVAADYSGTAEVTLSFNAYMVQATGNGENAADAWANTYGATTNP